jgi:hypothetical protein
VAHLPPGQIPTQALVTEAIAAAREALPEGARLFSRHEFVKAIANAPEGTTLSVNGPDFFSLDEVRGNA